MLSPVVHECPPVPCPLSTPSSGISIVVCHQSSERKRRKNTGNLSPSFLYTEKHCIHVLAVSISRNSSFSGKGIRACSAPYPGCDPVPAVPVQHRKISRSEVGAAWARSFPVTGQSDTVPPFLWFLTIKPGTSFTRSGILCLLQLILTAAELKCPWLEISCSPYFSQHFNCMWDINYSLSFSDLYFCITCCFRSWGNATRDNGSTVAFRLSGQIPELTSSAIMVHRFKHSDIRW